MTQSVVLADVASGVHGLAVFAVLAVAGLAGILSFLAWTGLLVYRVTRVLRKRRAQGEDGARGRTHNRDAFFRPASDITAIFFGLCLLGVFWSLNELNHAVYYPAHEVLSHPYRWAFMLPVLLWVGGGFLLLHRRVQEGRAWRYAIVACRGLLIAVAVAVLALMGWPVRGNRVAWAGARMTLTRLTKNGSAHGPNAKYRYHAMDVMLQTDLLGSFDTFLDATAGAWGRGQALGAVGQLTREQVAELPAEAIERLRAMALDQTSAAIAGLGHATAANAGRLTGIIRLLDDDIDREMSETETRVAAMRDSLALLLAELEGATDRSLRYGGIVVRLHPTEVPAVGDTPMAQAIRMRYPDLMDKLVAEVVRVVGPIKTPFALYVCVSMTHGPRSLTISLR